MKRIFSIVAFAFLTLLAGCDPYSFILPSSQFFAVEGKFLSHIDSFERLNKTRILLKSGGIVAIRSRAMTQFEASFRMRVIEPGVVQLHFRNAPTDFKAARGPITFTFTSDGSGLTGDARILPGGDFSKMQLKSGATHDFNIINDGKYLSVKADCERIWAVTSRPTTEWIIVEVLDGARIELLGIEFAYLETDSYIAPELRLNSDGKKISD